MTFLLQEILLFSLCTQQYIYTVDADEVLDETNRNKFLLLKTKYTS